MDYLVSSILWSALCVLNIFIATRMALMYKKDHDLRKLMFVIGLLIISNIYIMAIIGIDGFTFSRRIFDWCTLPLLSAFIFSLLHDRFSTGLNKTFKVFLLSVTFTFLIFFVPLDISAIPILTTGLIFALLLAIVQYSSKFDPQGVTLILSMPSFAVCYLAIIENMTEMAIFAGFIATAFMLLAFEVAKRQTGDNSSLLVIKNQLDKAEDNFIKLFSMLPDPAIIVDGKGTFLETTDNVSKITGFQREKIVGNNFVTTDILPAKSKAILVKNLAKRMLGFHVSPYEIEVISKDGRRLTFEVNSSKIDHKGKTAELVVLHDLTEIKKLIKSIEHEKRRFQAVAESTGDWIWEIDSYGKYVYSNPVVQKIMGYKAEEIIGKGFSEFLLPDEPLTIATFFNAFSKNPGSAIITKRCLHRNGHTVVLETRGAPIFGLNKEIVGYRGVDRDITEKNEMESKLLKTERLAAIGELATMVAHDLRNPLQSVTAAVYCLKKPSLLEDSEKRTAILQRVENALDYSEKIINDLLDYSAKITLEITETTPQSIINQAFSTINIPAGIEVVDKTKNTHKVYLDVNRIRRVCVNLILNAFEAMPEGGTLTITSKVGEDFELAFTDTGEGVSEDKIEKIMSPFFTTKAKGMGMGLAICKRIVESHNGKILVRSKLNQGTTFTLIIPMSLPKRKETTFVIFPKSILPSSSTNF
jgi:PAS domain S-box-containing protein